MYGSRRLSLGGKLKFFHPLTINVTIQGGFDMSRK